MNNNTSLHPFSPLRKSRKQKSNGIVSQSPMQLPLVCLWPISSLNLNSLVNINQNSLASIYDLSIIASQTCLVRKDVLQSQCKAGFAIEWSNQHTKSLPSECQTCTHNSLIWFLARIFYHLSRQLTFPCWWKENPCHHPQDIAPQQACWFCSHGKKPLCWFISTATRGPQGTEPIPWPRCDGHKKTNRKPYQSMPLSAAGHVR